MQTHFDQKYQFISVFDPNSGFYLRTGITEDGKISEEDPFMSSFPELLDVGIMGHCKHGQTGLCLKAGVECYQDGFHSNSPNMSLEDFKKIIEQVRGRTYQFALGGCGDPDEHEEFEEILKACTDNEIVVNFTTSGFGMTPEKAQLCKKYCGAVAISWYRSDYTLRAIEMLLEAGVKTNIHFVLSNSSLPEAIEILENNSIPEGINALIFLLHKPVGLGTQKEVIKIDNPLFEKFLSLVNTISTDFKIGFDSCTIPAIINGNTTIDSESYDTCEAARWSAYITPDMKLLPCSFDNQKQKWQIDLNTYSIEDAWNSQAFANFREYFKRCCPECEKRKSCLGGCPIVPEIVLCKRKQEI